MRNLCLAGIAALTIIGTSTQPLLAQPYPSGDGNQGGFGENSGQQMQDGRWMPPRWQRGPVVSPTGGPEQNGPPRGGWPPPPRPPHPGPPPPTGGEFHFKRGSAQLDIKCPQNQPLQACVQAAIELLDKLHSLRSSAPVPSKGPNGGSQPMQPDNGD